MSEKYQPTPKEMEVIDTQMAEDSEFSDLSAEREKEQRGFEQLTQKGFEQLKGIKAEDKAHTQSGGKRMLENLVTELNVFAYKQGGVPERPELHLLLIILFDKFKEMKELFERNRVNEDMLPLLESLLSDIQLNILEFAAKEGDLSTDWPLSRTWEHSGAKSVVMTDVGLSSGETNQRIQSPHGEIKIKELDVLNSADMLNGQNFDLICSTGFFGTPTHFISEDMKKPRKEVEYEVVKNLQSNLRPGGFFVFGTREAFALDVDDLESVGFEAIKCKLFQNYLIARKKGLFEGEKNE